MCVYDFEYYMTRCEPCPWDPAVHPQCACKSVAPGDTVTIWVEDREPDYIDCPSAPRDPWGDIHDDHTCPYCDHGDYERIPPDLNVATVCARCTAAAKVLDEWCAGEYAVDDIPRQLDEHWDEDELYRSPPFEQLVARATSGWRWPATDGQAHLPGVDPASPGLVPIELVEQWAAEAIAAARGAGMTGTLAARLRAAADPVLVLHFTQGTTIAGAVAAMRKARSECHEVVDPAMVASEGQALTQQSAPLDYARPVAEASAGRPETNNRGFGSNPLGRCYQVEIVGYSEKAATYGDVWYQRLGAYLDARCTALRIPPVFPLPFVGSQAYGASAPTRLTWEAWGRVAGIVGHQHVPGNEHWDPGALDVARLTRYMETYTTVPTTDPVKASQQRLNDSGARPPLVIDGVWGPACDAALDAVLKFQQGQMADLRKANATSADTIKRLTSERDEATRALDAVKAGWDSAEAEALQLRRQLQEGGRMPQLLADLDAAIAKARA